MKKINKFTFILSTIFSLIIIVLLSSEIKAQQRPSLATIAKKVLNASYPNRSYSVAIYQSITAPNGTKSAQAFGRGIFKKTINFTAKYNQLTGLKAQKVVVEHSEKNQKPKRKAIKNNQPTIVKPGDVRLIIDYSEVFKSIDNLQNVKISSVNFENQKHFKISFEYKNSIDTLWIQAINYFVSKSVVYINNSKYADITIQYKYINHKYWLPSQILYIQYPDKEIVKQLFSSYSFK